MASTYGLRDLELGQSSPTNPYGTGDADRGYTTRTSPPAPAVAGPPTIFPNETLADRLLRERGFRDPSYGRPDSLSSMERRAEMYTQLLNELWPLAMQEPDNRDLIAAVGGVELRLNGLIDDILKADPNNPMAVARRNSPLRDIRGPDREDGTPGDVLYRVDAGGKVFDLRGTTTTADNRLDNETARRGQDITARGQDFTREHNRASEAIAQQQNVIAEANSRIAGRNAEVAAGRLTLDQAKFETEKDQAIKNQAFEILKFLGNLDSATSQTNIGSANSQNQTLANLYSTDQGAINSRNTNETSLYASEAGERNNRANIGLQAAVKEYEAYLAAAEKMITMPQSWWQAYQKGLSAIAAGRAVPRGLLEQMMSTPSPDNKPPPNFLSDRMAFYNAQFGATPDNPQVPLTARPNLLGGAARPNLVPVPGGVDVQSYRDAAGEINREGTLNTDRLANRSGVPGLDNEDAERVPDNEDAETQIGIPDIGEEGGGETATYGYDDYGVDAYDRWASNIMTPTFAIADGENPEQGPNLMAAVAAVLEGDDPPNAVANLITPYFPERTWEVEDLFADQTEEEDPFWSDRLLGVG